MRRLAVPGSVALAVLALGTALTGCTADDPAEETIAPATAASTPAPGATYEESEPPTIDQIDVMAWGAGFLPALDTAAGDERKGEVMHAGETENAEFGNPTDAWTLRVACAADSTTSLEIAVTGAGADPAKVTLACAEGIRQPPVPAVIRITGSQTAKASFTAGVDTAVVVQTSAK